MFGLGYLSTVCIAFIYIFIEVLACVNVDLVSGKLCPSYDQSTPCIPCLYIEEVFAESRPSNRARADSCEARPDSRVSSATYLRILGA
jgi:hypothetical protein